MPRLALAPSTVQAVPGRWSSSSSSAWLPSSATELGHIVPPRHASLSNGLVHAPTHVWGPYARCLTRESTGGDAVAFLYLYVGSGARKPTGIPRVVPVP